VKRCIDMIVSALALVVLSPVLLLLGLLVRVKLGSPIFFAQERPGVGDRVFRMYKFRTMTDSRDEYGHLLPDEQRLTSFGRVLRANSADELPELWSVLKGDMSLIGPRPLLMEYRPLYTPEQARRHDVRPGITGLAQVRGRNALSWEEKFALDVWYVDHWLLGLDLRSLMETVRAVLSRRGIS
jgi:sugar transferase EpsL